MTPGAKIAVELGIPIDDEAAAPSEVKFTPGEWKLHQDNDENFHITTHPAGDLATHISTIHDLNRYDRNAEVLANANLIAASPQMYSALKNAPLMIDHDDHDSFVEAYANWFMKYRNTSLAKARGE